MVMLTQVSGHWTVYSVGKMWPLSCAVWVLALGVSGLDDDDDDDDDGLEHSHTVNFVTFAIFFCGVWVSSRLLLETLCPSVCPSVSQISPEPLNCF